MDIIAYLSSLYILPILVACLVVGYIIKKWIKDVDNKYIPTIVAILGTLLGGLTVGWTLEALVAGAVSGLASTGLHQLFKQWIEGGINQQEDMVGE